MTPEACGQTSKLCALLARPAVQAWGVVLAVAALYLPWLGLNDLMHEETRRAVIARTMMDSGNYLVPYLGERIYLNKPQFFNWLIALFSTPGGTVTEFSARLVSVVSLAVLALLMVLTAGRHLGTSARWLLGLGVVVTGEIMHKSVLGNVDTAFTMLVSASLWTWFALDERGRRGLMLWLPPAVLVGIAFLTKREPALVFYYLGIGAFLLSQRRFRELFHPSHLIAAGITLVLVGLWLVPVSYQAGLDTVVANFHREVLSRGISPDFRDYLTHFLTYPLEILVAALPTSVLLLALAWPSVWRAVHRRHGRLFVFAVLVVVVNLPIYWLRADVAVRYFMPMMPTMVAIAAMVFDTLLAERHAWPGGARRTQYALALFLALLAAGFGGAMVVLSIPGAFPDVAGPILPWPLMLALGLATLTALGYPLWRHRYQLPVVAFVAIVGFGVALRITEIGFRIPYEAERIVAEHDDVPAIVSRIRQEVPPEFEHVQAIGKMPHALWFYDREGLVVPAARFERRGEPVSPFLLIWTEPGPAPEWSDLEMKQVARIPYEDGGFLLMRLRDTASR
jgi:4-amino-4-deoxy-L-arabinose transferase-like glycosyltransferase